MLWFTTYQTTYYGTILMGNNHTCKIIECCTRIIKKHDGTVRTLINAIHVPNLQKKLIYLGVLKENCFKLALENRVLKVICDSLVMKEICHNTVYTCIGETII